MHTRSEKCTNKIQSTDKRSFMTFIFRSVRLSLFVESECFSLIANIIFSHDFLDSSEFGREPEFTNYTKDF